VSPLLLTVLIAMLPVSELRGAIPWALGVGKLSWTTAYLLAVLGNLLPVLPILTLLGPAERLLRQWTPLDRFFTWLFERTRRRSTLVERYEALGLMLFVAVPLPVTGAWTGCVAAYLFGIRRRYALPAIGIGVAMAGVVVTLATLGVIGGLHLFTRPV
jgi:uncharacterized membrane protein